MRAVFRCDANSEIGFGHLSRCIALAEAFRLSNVASTFAGSFDRAAHDQIAASGFGKIDAAGPVNSECQKRVTETEDTSSFIVVDSYRADADYLASLKARGLIIVVIDDFNAMQSYPCDVVLNFTWDAPSYIYPDGPALLLGPSYFPARRRIVDLRPESIAKERSGAVRKLLIAIGGSDPKRIAARLVRVLGISHSGLSLRVIAADGVGEIDLSPFAPDSAVVPRQPDLSEQLLWADACVTGGGLIKYESAFMCVPAAAVSQNQGQAGETQVLAHAGLVFDLGLADDCSDEDLGRGLKHFLGGDELRSALVENVREIFTPDPAANAARAIIEAVKR